MQTTSQKIVISVFALLVAVGTIIFLTGMEAKLLLNRLEAEFGEAPEQRSYYCCHINPNVDFYYSEVHEYYYGYDGYFNSRAFEPNLNERNPFREFRGTVVYFTSILLFPFWFVGMIVVTPAMWTIAFRGKSKQSRRRLHLLFYTGILVLLVVLSVLPSIKLIADITE